MPEKQGVNPISKENIYSVEEGQKPLVDFNIVKETIEKSSKQKGEGDIAGKLDKDLQKMKELVSRKEQLDQDMGIDQKGKNEVWSKAGVSKKGKYIEEGQIEENDIDKIKDLFTDKWMAINSLAKELKREKLAAGLNGFLSHPKNLKNIEDYKSWINRFEKIEKILSYIIKNKEKFTSNKMLTNFVIFLINQPLKYIDSFITLFMADKELQNINFEAKKEEVKKEKLKKEEERKEQILIADKIEKIRKDANNPLLQLNEAKVQLGNVQEDSADIEIPSEIDEVSKIKLPSIKDIRKWNQNESRNPVLDKLLAEEFEKQELGKKTDAKEKELVRAQAQKLLSSRIKQKQAEDDRKKADRRKKREAKKAQREARKAQEEEDSLKTEDLILDLSGYDIGLAEVEKKRNDDILKQAQDNRELVLKKLDIVEEVLPVKVVEEISTKKEMQEKKEDLITGRQKLVSKYDLALNRFNLELVELEEKIVLLENRMNVIKGVNTDKFNFEDDKDLVNYGDICRELTFIIQELNELDSKKAKMNVLAKKYKIRFNIIKNNERLSAPIGNEEKEWLNELDIDVKNQAELSVVVGKNAYELTFDTSSNNFGRLHHDQKSAENLNQYIAQQWNWVDSPKEISLADKEKISNIFAMDWLKKNVDPVTLANNTDLRRKINNSNNKLLLDIYKKHGMILPTEKAGIPLYFKDGQALIPSSYIDNVFTKFGKAFSTLNKAEINSFIEVTLYEKILTDPQVSLRQAMLIFHRLNKLLGDFPKLKKWMKLTDQKNNYKFLKVNKGWFQRMPREEIKEMIKKEGEGMLKTAFEIKETKLPEISEDEEMIVSDDMVIEAEEIKKEKIKEDVKFDIVEEDTVSLKDQMAEIKDDYEDVLKEIELNEERRLEIKEKQDEFVNHYLLYHFGLDAWKKKELLKDVSITKKQKDRYDKDWSPGKISIYKDFLKNDVRELLMTMGNSEGKEDADSYMRMINFLKAYTKKIKSEDHKDHKKYEKYKYLVDSLLKPAE